jgi:hypothetical protein
MRNILLFSIIVAASASTLAQDTPPANTSASKDARDAVIKGALARDRGGITAMEALNGDGKGVILGYSSGAVVNCHGEGNCRVFDGTPRSAITGAVSGISVSTHGGKEIVWVGYPHGIIYRCADYVCREIMLPGE